MINQKNAIDLINPSKKNRMKKIILIASFCFTTTMVFSQRPYKDTNGKYGFKLNDKIIIEARFDNVYNFQDGYAIVSISSEKGKGLGVIDTSGKEIIKPKLENEKITFKDGIFYVKIQGTKDEKTFNNKGEVIFIVDSTIITETELFNSIMSNSTVTIKEPALQETRDKIFEDLKSNETTVAQNKKETLYYNKYWGICSKSEASYYRVITLDVNEKPVGVVRDYYISGKLQSEGEAIFFDKLDDTNTKWKNKVTGYYENGMKQFEENYDNEGNKIGPTKNWDEFGVMDISIIFRNETLNQLQDSQLNATKEEFKMYSKDERILEGGKVIREKSASGDYSYYIVDKNNDVIMYILYSNNYDFQYTASKMIDLSTVRQMERELAEKGFEKVQKKGSATIASNNADNSVAFEVWTRQDYPYTFYLQTFNCNMKNCQIGMYANAFFTNP